MKKTPNNQIMDAELAQITEQLRLSPAAAQEILRDIQQGDQLLDALAPA